MSADIHSLVGAYVVDAVDDAERRAFEDHLAQCPECRAEVADLREAAASLSLLTEASPPATLKDAVLAQARTTRPLPPSTVPDPSPERGPVTVTDPGTVVPLRRRPVAWLVAAAAAVAVVVGGLAWSPWSQDERPQSPTQQVLAAKDAQRFVQTVGGARATIVRSASLGRAVIVADDMPAAPAGKDYQLWLDQPGKGMVSAGLMPHGTAATVTVLLDGDASTATGAGITLEPAGGSTEPTSTPLALFAFS